MLKHAITYEDFNGDTVTENFYFNLSKPELIELEVEYDKGFASILQNIIESKDRKELVSMFKRIILMAYGEKSPDGKRFIKSDQLREEFSQTAAYQHLFMELATEDGFAANFVVGIMPKDMQAEVEKAQAEEAENPKVEAAPAPTTDQ